MISTVKCKHMNKNQLQNEILAIIKTVFDDKKALQKIHAFLLSEVYEEPQPEEIPVKYKKVVFEITESLIAGFTCYFNPDTLEFEDTPGTGFQNPGEFELLYEESYDTIELKHQSWTNYIEIEPMESHDSFKIMEYFIDELSDKNFQNKLINALNRKKPFANFKHLVENSDYRQQWFDYRRTQYGYYVWNVIKTEM